MRKLEFNDTELINLYKNGNEGAFATLVQRYKTRLLASIQSIVKDREEAEDLLQEALIKAVDTIKAGKYNEEGKFLPWLTRIGHNLAIDHFRKQKRFTKVRVDDKVKLGNLINLAEDSAESSKIRKETHSQLKTMIYDLPQSQKQVLMMRHFMHMSFQEIADSTGVSINTALGRMRYALISLRKRINENEFTTEQMRMAS
ncbi:MAG: sigma-70 family RNA polymerase sigma factor [Thermoflexibacter sp.]|jgi:RNA polymerase sigma-70 factor (ECF subfamily)|nr:sigma-70 family RNA polymerase sigma factor [Thermoflexibacter sp.]